jgi:hypothetical protein
MDAVKELKNMTYVAEHSPNCPMRYLVRLPGIDKGVIDKKPYSALTKEKDYTQDILGFGRTFKEAGRRALTKRESLLKRRR